MSSEDRKDPDALLRAINAQARNETQASLRLFLGMSAGVGKTFAMLKAAHQYKLEGVDVVIGAVETHGRSETAALLEGLSILPRRKINYRGTELEEMDLDGILKRRPALVVVDELAHTNVPGSRHEKRYQDVLEILDAGINVLTALNVQHLESRKDSAEAITGIPIRETVPDGILERATLVELVDIAPTELLKRLKEGKVYWGDKAERAAQNFFKEDKLTALREIALRITAERVDQDLQQFSSVRQDVPWQTNERLLVAISHSPYSERLIRGTRRLAYNLEAPWIALHVDTGMTLNDADQSQLMKNLTLARELKAEVITTADVDLATAMRRICRQKNVTQIVLGRPTRRWFRNLLEGGSLLERMVRYTEDVDVHVLRQESTAQTKRPNWWTELSMYRAKSSPIKYWYSSWLILGISALCAFAEPYMGFRTVGFFYLFGVLVAGLLGSIGAVFYAAALSGLAWDFFFIPPRFSFSINTTEDFSLLASYFSVAVLTGVLTSRIRGRERLIREREERTQVLYQTLQDIASSSEKSDFLRKITDRVGHILGAQCSVFLKSQSGHLEWKENIGAQGLLTEKDRAVADWAYRNQKPAGWGTDTLAESNTLFIPLTGAQEPVGVFAFQPQKKSRKLDLEQENLLYSLMRQLGHALERHFLAKRLFETQRLKDSEELHQTLLNSVSHEMRTPLTAILAAAASLQQPDIADDKVSVQTASRKLLEAGDRLNRVIENLLDMSRLSSGVLALHLEWHEINDLIGVVLSKLEGPLQGRQVDVAIVPDCPLLRIDFRLMEHALSNLIVNASMYSPEKSKIWISAKLREPILVLSVEDEGPGIPEGYIPHIFEKFYRVPGSRTGGTGLGLSIVKSIVELHRGSVRMENRNPHGARLIIELPIEKQPSLPQEAP